MKRTFALFMLVVFAVMLFSPLAYADQPSFLEDSLEKEKEIKTSSWFERQLAGLIANVAKQFYEWMEVWGLHDPYDLITADNPGSKAANLGLNSETVQDAKENIYDKFYKSAVVPIAALFIVIIGFQYAMAQNDEGQRKAKEMVIALLTFFVTLFAVDIIFNFLVDVEIATIELIKNMIVSGAKDFSSILLGATPSESMSAIRSISLAIIALLFVFFMLRMNFIYLVRMISLLVLVAILPFSAALSIWPQFRASLSMLMKEFFAQLFLPIGHAVVLLAMYYVAVKGTNAFYMIPFIFGMGAVERIIRSVFGVDTGFGSSFGAGILATLGGVVSSARGGGKLLQNQRTTTEQPKEKIPRTVVSAPTPAFGGAYGDYRSSAGPTSVIRQGSGSSTPRSKGTSSSAYSSASGSGVSSGYGVSGESVSHSSTGSAGSSSQSRNTGASSSTSHGSTGSAGSSSSIPRSEDAGISPAYSSASGSGVSAGSVNSRITRFKQMGHQKEVTPTLPPKNLFMWTNERPLRARTLTGQVTGRKNISFKTYKRPHITPSYNRFNTGAIAKPTGGQAILRTNPNASLSSHAKLSRPPQGSSPIRARADRIGPMTEFDKNTPATKELYAVNQDQNYVSIPHTIGRGLQTAARATAIGAGKAAKAAAPVVVKKGGEFSYKTVTGSARLAAGVTAGAVMYGLTGDSKAAGISAYGASSFADKTVRTTLDTTGKGVKTVGTITVRSANKINDIIKRRREEREKMQKQMIASQATGRFRDSLITKN
ncbi:MAG: hypothetical protein IMW92_10370 [Bacillales bacterium]|nr:hypothetical protein [Bacillales bacterium]